MFVQTEETDDGFNFNDFLFNQDLKAAIESEQTRREYNRCISYKNEDHLQISEDAWLYIVDFIPFVDFHKFSLVCMSFAEILTYHRRYLILKKMNEANPSVLNNEIISAESIRQLTFEKSPSDDCKFSDSLFFDILDMSLRRGHYKTKIFNFLTTQQIKEGGDDLYLLPLKEQGPTKEECYSDFKQNIPSELANNKEFIMKALDIAQSGTIYNYLEENMRADRDIIMHCLLTRSRLDFSKSLYQYYYYGSYQEGKNILTSIPEKVKLDGELLVKCAEYCRRNEYSLSYLTNILTWHSCNEADVMELVQWGFFTCKDFQNLEQVVKALFLKKGIAVSSFRKALEKHKNEKWVNERVPIMKQFENLAQSFSVSDVFKKIAQLQDTHNFYY